MTTREDVLKQIWRNHFETLEWERAFELDESLARAIAYSLQPMPAEKEAALEYWRERTYAAVDEIVQRYKATEVNER
jgi:hypothetical protein